MPTAEWNTGTWDGDYDWSAAGDEWSAPWGTTAMQWHGAIWPRIHPFVPAGTILEIAPGFGRWTAFLKGLCTRLIVVDLSERCIAACRRRFAAETHLDYHVNDGKSLAAVPDGAVDFAFSFDSLVHAEADAIASYLAQLPAKLTPDGVGFVHHSNLGEYPQLRPGRGFRPLRTLWKLFRLTTPTHSRALSLTAAKFATLATTAGLACVSQEVINWRGPHLIDCLSVVTRPGSRWDRPHRLVRNPHFMAEAARLAALAELYPA